MDFILSLTHFCEVHGPTSILCSQVLPFSCTQCHPSEADGSVSPSGTPSTSHETTSSTTSSLRNKLSSSLTASIKSNSANASQNIEDHPYFLKAQKSQSQIRVDPASERVNRVGGVNGDTCASCSISLPEDVSKKLPASSSGQSDGENGRGAKNNSPVLRSREVVHSCGGGNRHSDICVAEDDDGAHEHDAQHASLPDSVHSVSVTSSSSDTSCHTHILTYLSLHGPPNPADYALLRQSSIRTLSCELLPRGLSSGPLCFGDPVAGYTIAYVFRLPDPMARGKRRSYALIALAGKDAGRAFRASPIIWRIFQRIAAGIVTAAEKHQEEEKMREEQAFRASTTSSTTGRHDYTPISSFLTGRTLDANGNPRRAGQIRARNLAEIVGNEYIFAELHAQFVTLLQQLGNMFGGVPISDERFVCSTVSSSESPVSQSRRTSVAVPKQGHSRQPSELALSSLNISSAPQPIPISPRRPIVA
ncbi:conserved hypothetical protein [Talaromyces stipitatus ATCC 10500]|uniref:UDENN FLCN/SMCR8-type domain-containing protein n=1 Tax=Talaromyces stipitatus (strain ATCC 10500 / CBS 375.48 / QM 6759 / NRRL 1006) TaxID=441959 RepID=B8M6Z3_TALSN|nr:uncharacterized protein TSTA_034510 [Talaromyces stipitatus ATCC 10500]EED20213.1 conserved hypothetical protein [Talaromyces stipitatus ATCC 10500]